MDALCHIGLSKNSTDTGRRDSRGRMLRTLVSFHSRDSQVLANLGALNRRFHTEILVFGDAPHGCLKRFYGVSVRLVRAF